MRTCGAEKLPWLVVEVEVGAERAGCFAERQLRLGLFIDEAIPESRDRLRAHAERRTNELEVEYEVWFSAQIMEARAAAVVLGEFPHTRTSVVTARHRGRGVPQERDPYRFP